MTDIIGARPDQLISEEWMARVMSETLKCGDIPDHIRVQDIRCLILDLQRSRYTLRELGGHLWNEGVLLRKLTQIRKLALSAEGYAWDLVIALAEEAIAALEQQEGQPQHAAYERGFVETDAALNEQPEGCQP